MGVCINWLGIPILEDADCAAKRRAQKGKRQENRQDTRVAVVESKQEQQALSSYFRNYGTGETPLEGAIGSVTDTIGGFLGISPSTSTAPPIDPVLVLGGVAVLVGGIVYLTRK